MTHPPQELRRNGNPRPLRARADHPLVRCSQLLPGPLGAVPQLVARQLREGAGHIPAVELIGHTAKR
jgi:hypothetical protein